MSLHLSSDPGWNMNITLELDSIRRERGRAYLTYSSHTSRESFIPRAPKTAGDFGDIKGSRWSKTSLLLLTWVQYWTGLFNGALTFCVGFSIDLSLQISIKRAAMSSTVILQGGDLSFMPSHAMRNALRAHPKARHLVRYTLYTELPVACSTPD